MDMVPEVQIESPMRRADPQRRKGRIMDDFCADQHCTFNTMGLCMIANSCGYCSRQVHESDLTTAGQVGSSDLLIAREGKQQFGPTAFQLAALIARDACNHDPGCAHCLHDIAESRFGDYCRKCYQVFV